MNHFLLLYFLFFSPNVMDQKDYINITEMLPVEEFNTISQFILQNGDKKTYCNRYNNNPHLEMVGFDLFLTPESTTNINCDPEISGFNEIVIYAAVEELQYYHILLVKNLKKKKNNFIDAEEVLIENQVYLSNIYYKDPDEMLEKLTAVYLPLIKQRCLK